MNPDRQQESEMAAVQSYIEFLEITDEGQYQIEGRPDRHCRTRKAPDWTIQKRSGGPKTALEITALHRGKAAGYDDAVWDETFGGLDEELRTAVPENVLMFFPSVSAAIPELSTGVLRKQIRDALRAGLPMAIRSVNDYDKVQDIIVYGVPFKIGIRKRRQEGRLKITRLVEIPSDHDLAGIKSYLGAVLPGKLAKFDSAEWDGYRRVLILDNRVAFLDADLLEKALSSMAREKSLAANRLHALYMLAHGGLRPVGNGLID